VSLATTTTPVAQAPAVPTATRLVSLDAFRGFTMLFMASEILHIESIARGFPDSTMARIFANLLEHRAWVGCSPWDLIQPSFMFMVGVSLPYSIASRVAKGQSELQMFAHTLYRAFVLVALGIFLRSQQASQTYFTFEDVLTQIGLGYVFLYLLGRTRARTQWIAAAVILAGYWAAFALYPLPPAGFDTTAVGVAHDWPHRLSGFAAHWDKNTNLAHAFDVWFLNLFPREEPFLYNSGGYLTLNFVPSLATMIFGLLAGGLLRTGLGDKDKLRRLLMYGVAGILLGAALHVLGVVPLVKRIWTPSWAIFSAGWAVSLLAVFYYAIDMRGRQRWAFPFLVVGMNSIMMYVVVHVATDYMFRAFTIHLGRAPFEVFGPAFAPIVLGAATLTVFWLILYWMYQRKVFLRI
jgi:heparan-alpha-glucosaminide N-acetyltransferase